MIVTLSRQTAAGARIVAANLARRMHFRVLDADVIRLVAERLHTSEEDVTILDERLEPAEARLLRTLGMAVAPEVGVSLFVGQDISADDVQRATREVILDLAGREPLIIVGRGGCWILGKRPDTLHVRLVAPFETRVERFMAELGIDRKMAGG